MPPNSRETFLTVPAHWDMSSLPTAVEPVNESLRTIGLLVSSPPTATAFSVGRTLNTPGGMPASSARAANASAESGVSGAGLITTVQPAAMAGAHLRVIMALGKFQG